MKIANFSYPCVFNAPAEGGSLGIGYRRRGQKKLELWCYQKVEKSFKIVLAVLVQYRRVTDSQPASHSHVAVACTRYASASRSKNRTDAGHLVGSDHIFIFLSRVQRFDTRLLSVCLACCRYCIAHHQTFLTTMAGQLF